MHLSSFLFPSISQGISYLSHIIPSIYSISNFGVGNYIITKFTYIRVSRLWDDRSTTVTKKHIFIQSLSILRVLQNGIRTFKLNVFAGAQN